MQLVITKQFEKDSKDLSKANKHQLAETIEFLQAIKSFQEIPNLKKLKGYKTAYRIRIGDYRIGFLFEDNMVKLSRILHRKEIYRYFP